MSECIDEPFLDYDELSAIVSLSHLGYEALPEHDPYEESINSPTQSTESSSDSLSDTLSDEIINVDLYNLGFRKVDTYYARKCTQYEERNHKMVEMNFGIPVEIDTLPRYIHVHNLLHGVYRFTTDASDAIPIHKCYIQKSKADQYFTIYKGDQEDFELENIIRQFKTNKIHSTLIHSIKVIYIQDVNQYIEHFVSQYLDQKLFDQYNMILFVFPNHIQNYTKIAHVYHPGFYDIRRVQQFKKSVFDVSYSEPLLGESMPEVQIDTSHQLLNEAFSPNNMINHLPLFKPKNLLIGDMNDSGSVQIGNGYIEHIPFPKTCKDAQSAIMTCLHGLLGNKEPWECIYAHSVFSLNDFFISNAEISGNEMKVIHTIAFDGLNESFNVDTLNMNSIEVKHKKVYTICIELGQKENILNHNTHIHFRNLDIPLLLFSFYEIKGVKYVSLSGTVSKTTHHSIMHYIRENIDSV